jgi:hypothetical protein
VRALVRERIDALMPSYLAIDGDAAEPVGLPAEANPAPAPAPARAKTRSAPARKRARSKA